MGLKGYGKNLNMFVIKNLIYDYMGLKDYGELSRQEEELNV